MDNLKMHESYHRLFNTPEGKEVLEDMKRAHFFYSSTFNPQFPEMTTLNEGGRNVVLRILTILDNKPEREVEENAGT